MNLIDLINTRMESLEVVAKNAGISRQTLYNIIKGDTPSILTIKKLCKYFGVDYKNYI